MEKKIWKIKWFLKNFWEDQRGMGVVEVIQKPLDFLPPAAFYIHNIILNGHS